MDLVQRAVAYLDAHGSTTPAELARAVFGGEAFLPLLASLEHERLTYDGQHWSLRAPSDELAILEVLASGPNPQRHEVIEVAAERQGRTFAVQIAGRKAVPQALRKLGVPAAGPDCVELEDAAASLREFLCDAAVAGFSYVPAFMDQLLGPGWPAIDLLRLLYETSEYGGRPDPTRLAKHFGISAPLSRRPHAMLTFSAALLGRLREGRSAEQMRAIAAPRIAVAPLLPELPPEPGVYVMSTSDGPLYVGKSINLSRRVPSYFGRPIAESRALYHLAQMTERVDVVPVSSELEALLLEARLIEEWEPAFNVQKRRHARCRYLRLSSSEPFPRLTESRDPAADGATYFGPFRHTTAARRLRLLLTSLLRLRTCSRQLPSARKPRPACAKALAGACLAPCIPGPPPAPYGAEVVLAERLLGATPDEFRRLVRQLLRDRPPEEAGARKLKGQLERLRAPTAPPETQLWD